MLAILEGPDLIIVLVVVLVLFGGAQLPKLARGLGEAQREFRKGLHDVTGGPDPRPGPAQPAEAPSAPAPSAPTPVPPTPVPPTPVTSTPVPPTPAATTPEAAVPPAAPTLPATTAGQPRPERVQGPLKSPPILRATSTQPVVEPSESANAPAPAKNGQHTAGATASTPPTAAPPAAQRPVEGTDNSGPQTPPV